MLFRSLGLVASSAAASDEAVEVGKKVAAEWVALLDDGKGEESWEAACSVFKKQVEKGEWVGMLGQLRGSLGAVDSRELESAKFSTQVPNSPDGEYVMVVYTTSFEKRAGAEETVVTMRDEDGELRVVGDFIQ